MNKFILAIAGLFLATIHVWAYTLEERPEYHWNLNVRYEPRDTVIQGIPIAKLDPSWTAASVLTMEDQPPAAIEELREARSSPFVADGDFNKNGRPDRALVGVYRNRAGAFGRFLLIVEKYSSGRWKKVFLQPWSQDPGFSTVAAGPENITVRDCLGCDNFWNVRWMENAYAIEPQPADSENRD